MSDLGRGFSGAGGAGGIYLNEDYTFPQGTYEIVVGEGGQIPFKNQKGYNGGNTQLGSVIVYGGGAGGMLSYNATQDINGNSGGSGGGAGRYTNKSLGLAYGTAGNTVDSEQGSNAITYQGGSKPTQSDITGKMITYATANVNAIQNTGAGGNNIYIDRNVQQRASQSGANGIVVIRVPKNESIETTGIVNKKEVVSFKANEKKYVFLTSIPSIVLSDSATGDDLPELGYKAFRKLGYIQIDDSTHISSFTREVDNLPWK